MKELLLKALNEFEIYDVHSHMDCIHLTARGLHDILLYHMVVTELYSAGCPNGSRIPEDADEDEIKYRIEEAIPYLPYIRNTSIYHAMCRILSDLYDWNETITLDNWRKIDERIKLKYEDKEWASEIFKRAGVKRAVTELCRRHDGRHDDIFSYSLEWAFFARSQWGQYDTPLLELEYAWSKEEPGELAI